MPHPTGMWQEKTIRSSTEHISVLRLSSPNGDPYWQGVHGTSIRFFIWDQRFTCGMINTPNARSSRVNLPVHPRSGSGDKPGVPG